MRRWHSKALEAASLVLREDIMHITTGQNARQGLPAPMTTVRGGQVFVGYESGSRKNDSVEETLVPKIQLLFRCYR